ncbi:hypothetical protein B0H11DRAFT_2064145, partial [Mycena galericulata]
MERLLTRWSLTISLGFVAIFPVRTLRWRRATHAKVAKENRHALRQNAQPSRGHIRTRMPPRGEYSSKSYLNGTPLTPSTRSPWQTRFLHATQTLSSASVLHASSSRYRLARISRRSNGRGSARSFPLTRRYRPTTS